MICVGAYENDALIFVAGGYSPHLLLDVVRLLHHWKYLSLNSTSIADAVVRLVAAR